MEGRKEGGQEGRLTVCGFSLEVAFSGFWLLVALAFGCFCWLFVASVGFCWLFVASFTDIGVICLW